ncbi:coiled-coil domain-containing protein lobo [Condylostylus longicornis]|uniref:coiled-coil domain-containing protein lobo n=1 Tax=Condylostylus longicornis TaxID=2530218 RepID=UPI00244E1967|nr:coiled-coil domain-containing protein lobo [Condylostylus longicornis]
MGDLVMPPTIISPETLLRRRQGNSYEMAILLASLLIGAGYPAMVVSGFARYEITLNDQRKFECPYLVDDDQEPPVKKEELDEWESRYVLKDDPDLTSHLQDALDERAREKQAVIDAEAAEEAKRKAEWLSQRSSDKYHNRRRHAWVVIIENAPWSIKPRTFKRSEEGKIIYDPLKAFFIEPSSGFRYETDSLLYIYVESIWNQYNYYISCQTCRAKHVRWDLSKTEDWEHLLPGEPLEMRVQKYDPDEDLDKLDDTHIEKHLDIIRSWVGNLHIGDREFEQRYPNESKTVHYKQTVHERYSPYSRKDGKTEQLTIFADNQYKEATTRWEWYKNRLDMLERLKVNFVTEDIEEKFHKGRPDSLMKYEHGSRPDVPKKMYFYALSRLDSLEYMEIHQDKIIMNFQERSDRLIYQEIQYRERDMKIEKVIEKFSRNYDVQPSKDILERRFLRTDNKIWLKFQYAENAITTSTREFIRPPPPKYGGEILFDSKLTKGYHANPNEPKPTEFELYLLLLSQMKYDETLDKVFENRLKEIDKIIEKRGKEFENPKLMFRIFDSLRNQAARVIRIKEFEDEEKRLAEVKIKDADFLGPYLVPYASRKPNYKESQDIMNNCLLDLKTHFVCLLNDLQRKYEDLTMEVKSINKFLNKFQDQFDNYECEKLIEEAKDLELNKRMVQQRLAITQETAQAKYEKVKRSLTNDERLTLKLGGTISANLTNISFLAILFTTFAQVLKVFRTFDKSEFNHKRSHKPLWHRNLEASNR